MNKNKFDCVRKVKKSLTMLGVVLCSTMTTLTFSACSDDIAEEVTPSTVDPKQWNLDANMDTSVKPGDDFARYCWGKWYDAQGVVTNNSVGIAAEASIETDKKVNELDLKELQLIKQDLASLGEDEDGMAQLQQNITNLIELRKNPSTTCIATELGKFLASGKRSSLVLKIYPQGNSCKYDISRNSLYSPQYASDIVMLSDDSYNRQTFTKWLIQLGLEEEDAQKVVTDGLVQDFDNKSAVSASDGDLNCVEIVDAFCQGLGVDASSIHPNQVDTIGNLIGKNAMHIVDMMICHEAADILLVSRNANEQYSNRYAYYNDEAFIYYAVNPLLRYPLSKAFCDKYCTKEMHDMVIDMMEDLRTAFASRIDQLTWMSSTTKQKAKEKLSAMKFYALYPDNWLSAGFPELKGNSLYEDIQILRQTDGKLKNDFLSLSPREDMMNFNIINDQPTYTVNCFYWPDNNTASIFAPYIMSPYYSSENSDATLYAIGAALGHEITHGFDNNGALYGPTGEDTNWWTVSDKQEYDERTKLLVDCYNHLPGYMDCPGSTFAKGEKTLGENIADLGGLEIALQAYTAKLEEQGYYGDELAKQQKRFFQAYANTWRAKYSEEYNQKWLYSSEPHANDYTRILGPTMNCNRWYELYDVQWGDKNYLKPEKRTHIW